MDVLEALRSSSNDIDPNRQNLGLDATYRFLRALGVKLDTEAVEEKIDAEIVREETPGYCGVGLDRHDEVHSGSNRERRVVSRSIGYCVFLEPL